MKQQTDFKFKISLSVDNYNSKDEVTAAICGKREDRKKYGIRFKMGFRETELTPSELLNYGLNGKSFCNLFHNIPSSIKESNGRVINLIRKTDGAFGLNAKKDSYFYGSYIICFDIEDTKYKSASSFIEKLTFKPTLYYSTFSNQQRRENGSSKGARFRLVYVFDELIQGKVFFNYVFDVLNEIVEKDVNEITSDKCSRKPTQYFNGTNINNPDMIVESGITNYIYSFDDFSISKGYNYLYWIKSQLDSSKLTSSNKKFYIDEYNYIISIINKEQDKEEDKTTTINNEMEKGELLVEVIKNDETCDEVELDGRILYKWDNLTPDMFVKDGLWVNWLNNTKNIYRTEKDIWINDEYQFVDDDYFMLFWNTHNLKDGEKRRKNLYQRMCLRRVMCPSATPNEIMFNTILDILRRYDNNDGVLNSDFIRRNITNCFSYSVDELKETYATQIKYLQETTRPKKGIIYRDKMTHSKETTFKILDDYYDTDLTVKENISRFTDDYGFKIGKSMIYEYLKNRNIKTNSNKLTDKEVLEMIDWNLNAIENFNIIKSKGFLLQKNRLFRLYRENKNKEEVVVSNVVVHKTTTINNEMEKGELVFDTSVFTSISDLKFNFSTNSNQDYSFNPTTTDNVSEEEDYSSEYTSYLNSLSQSYSNEITFKI